MKISILLFFCCVLILPLKNFAQNLTGTWEGKMGADQFLQVNILQKGDHLCGYTYDYVLYDRFSYCKAYFNSSYNKKNKEWLLTGSSFIENTSAFNNGHLLMRLRLTYYEYDGKQMLKGSSSVKSLFLSMLSGGISESVYLEKVAGQPGFVYPAMKDCLTEPRKKDSLITKDSIAMVKKELPGKDTVLVKRDTVVTVQRTEENKDSLSLTRKMTERKNENITTLKINTGKISIRVFDNGITDDDTVSVFYNNRLLLSHQRLSSKPINLELELDKNVKTHEIVLFAENLGRIPPNTALVVIIAGDKRFELHSSADLKKNASVLLEYDQ